MFLEYGITADGELIRIEQAPRGRLNGIFCPYCHRPLIARKGTVKAPHFAHDGDTCAAANRDGDTIALPAYDRFNLSLSPKELAALRDFADGGTISEQYLERLEQAGCLRFNEWNTRRGDYELTKRGKIPLGTLSLMLFNDVQEDMIRQQYAALEAAAYATLDSAAHEISLIDLRLFRAQWRRILSLTLYYLEITHTGGTLHKIGVTSRPMDERLAEIATDLRGAGLTGVSVKVVDTWAHRGNVELYFKHRYAASRQLLGNLTEYFTFPDPSAVQRDLRRMKPKTLDALEQSILAGDPAPVERGAPPGQPLTFEQWQLIRTQARLDPAFWIDDEQPAHAIAREIIRAEHTPPLVKWDSDLHHGWHHWLTDYGRNYARRFERFYRQRYEAEYAELERQRRDASRRAAIRAGMQRAAADGQHVGRPSDDAATILAKYPEIATALREGLSLRATMARTGAAINTVRKVKAALETT